MKYTLHGEEEIDAEAEANSEAKKAEIADKWKAELEPPKRKKSIFARVAR